MELVYDEEQEEFRAALTQFLQAKSAEQDVRRLMATDTGYDPAVWKQMSEQMQLQALAIPDEYGGAGYGFREQALAFEEMGRALLCAPYFASVGLAANLLLAIGDPAASADFLPGIASGDTIATVAVLEQTGAWNEDAVSCAAEPDGDGWRLHGTKHYVLDGASAGLVLVAARTPAGVSVFAVNGHDSGLSATSLSTLDQTRKQARLDLDDATGRLIGGDGSGWAAIRRMADLAAIALAAEQVGGADRVLRDAVTYARDRIQFGVPIGSFQAIKHKCANMLMLVEQARSTVYYAASVAAADDDDLPLASTLALTYASSAFMHAAAESIQIHGGTGFTWEHSAHLYFKRAASSRQLFGGAQERRRRIADLAGL